MLTVRQYELVLCRNESQQLTLDAQASCAGDEELRREVAARGALRRARRPGFAFTAMAKKLYDLNSICQHVGAAQA